jgi:hypothetical protein
MKASFTPFQTLALTIRTESSYVLVRGTLDDLVAYLESMQFLVIPSRSGTEYLRLRNEQGAIVVLYHRNGVVLIQGKQQAQIHEQLRQFVDDPPGAAQEGLL